MTTNFIKFENDNIEQAFGKGNIVTLDLDIELEAQVNNSDSADAPTHRLYSFSPKGRKVEVGGIWKRQNKSTGADYYTISVRSFGQVFRANLGRYPEQDDVSLQSIIPWTS